MLLVETETVFIVVFTFSNLVDYGNLRRSFVLKHLMFLIDLTLLHFLSAFHPVTLAPFALACLLIQL